MDVKRLTEYRTRWGRQSWGRPFFPALRAAVLMAAVLLLHAETSAAAPVQQEKKDRSAPLQREIETHLYKIQLQEVALERFLSTGGAIEPLGDGLLVATARGRIGVLDSAGVLRYLDPGVPMYASVAEAPVPWIGFRVADILLKEESPGVYTLFASHHFLAGECVEIRISSIGVRVEKGEPSLVGDWSTLFSATPCIATALFERWEGEVPKVGGGIQIGGKMLIDGAHHLLIAVGDNAWYEWQELQTEGQAEKAAVIDAETHLGKLVRVELASGAATAVARGFRNPQGLIRDGEGATWLTDHGPQGGDELNLVKPGLDYGWPLATHGILYGNKVWPYNIVQGAHAGYAQPVYSWIPSIGISSLTLIDGGEFSRWQGDLLIGALRSSSLFRVRVRQERVVYYERIPLGERIRDITQMPDGRIVLLTDSSKLIFVRRAPLYCHADYSSTDIYTYDAEEVCVDLFGFLGEGESPGARSLQRRQEARLLVRADFDVYIQDGRLIYVRDPCDEEALQRRFFLHVVPLQEKDIFEASRDLGLNIYDFDSGDEGTASAPVGGACFVARDLPLFAIRSIHTGQVMREAGGDGEVRWVGPVWEARYRFDHGDLESGGEREESSAERAAPAERSSVHPGAALFAVHCAGCHALTERHGIGPHLSGVMGRPAGLVTGFNASDALRGLEVSWTPENLARFIADPAGFAPGADKGNLGLSAEEARLIADYLASQH